MSTTSSNKAQLHLMLIKGGAFCMGLMLGLALNAQNWQAQSQSPGANYYSIKAAHDSVPPDDTTGDGEEAKYRRFDAFWASRVETGDPSVSGLLSNYTNKLSEYFTDPLCPNNVNPSPGSRWVQSVLQNQANIWVASSVSGWSLIVTHRRSSMQA